MRAIWSWIPPKYGHCGQGFVSTTSNKADSTTCCWQLMYRINLSKFIESLFLSHSSYLLTRKLYLIWTYSSVSFAMSIRLQIWEATAWILRTFDWFTSQISITNCMEDVFSTAVTTLHLRFYSMSTMFIFISLEMPVSRTSEIFSDQHWNCIAKMRNCRKPFFWCHKQ